MSTGRRWHIAANFFADGREKWLDDFISDERLTFVKIPAIQRDNWHQRGLRTGLRQWIDHFRHGWRAIRRRPDGVITCFPQLAVCVSALKMAGIAQPRLVAHNFNLGEISSPWKRRLANMALRGVDRFLVHSPIEVERYSYWLNLPAERFQFVPLQRGKIDIDRVEDDGDPFILAMGSAHRDYDSLIEAVTELGIRTIIVTKQDIIERLPKPDNVEFITGLSQQDCLELLARARLSVTPIGNMDTASGQVTFVNAMQLGVPVLATRCPGTDGYIEDGETGVLLEPFDADDMRDKIGALWGDADLRQKIGTAGRRAADAEMSDEGAAETLRQILLTI